LKGNCLIDHLIILTYRKTKVNTEGNILKVNFQKNGDFDFCISCRNIFSYWDAVWEGTLNYFI